MPIKKKKISELKEALDLKGFFTIGYRMIDGVKENVKYGLEQIQNLYENLVKAISDAQEATTDMRQLETTVGANEEQRQITENQRVASEHERQVSESERIATEYDRIYAENDRKVAEVERSTSEVARQEAEGVRDSAEAVRVTEFATLKQESDTATGVANAAAASANQAAIGANQAADNANEQAVLAATAADNANDTANHPIYIGQDHYVYKWNKEVQAYDKTDIYTKGDAFSIKEVYPTVAALEADVNNPDIVVGDFVLVNTEDVENPDNAKLYVKVQNVDTTYSYSFLVDMSGAIGFTGKTPQFSMGTITTLEAGVSATATVSEDGIDTGGNPKYKISFAIPRGNPGTPFQVKGQYATIEGLQTAIPDGSIVEGFIAIGEKDPYEYYAWVNGIWMNQGKIANEGDGKMVLIPSAILNLTNTSTSNEILDVFGSKEAFIDIVTKVKDGSPAAINANGTLMILSACNGTTDESNNKYALNIIFINPIDTIANSIITVTLTGDIATINMCSYYNSYDNIVHIPFEIISLKHLDKSDNILSLFGGIENISFIIEKLKAGNCVAVFNGVNRGLSTVDAYSAGSVGTNYFQLNLNYFLGMSYYEGVLRYYNGEYTYTKKQTNFNFGQFLISDPSAGGINYPASAEAVKVLNDNMVTLNTEQTMRGIKHFQSVLDSGDIRMFTMDGTIHQYRASTGGWAMGPQWVKNDDTNTPLVMAGAFGSNATSMNYYYIGKAYDSTWMRVLPTGMLNVQKGIKTNNICIESSPDGTEPGIYSSEINNLNSHLFLQHHSSNSVIMCNGGGNVGIGTTTPQTKLDVRGEIRIEGVADEGLIIVGSEATSTRIKGKIGSSLNSPVSRYEVQWYDHFARVDVKRGGSTDIIGWSWKIDDTEKMYLNNNGDLGITGSAHAAGGFWKDSDVRLKSNITPLRHTLEQILSIPTDSFLMNDKEQIGTIAQEIEKVCPEVVSETLVSKFEVPESDDWETIIQPGHDGKDEEYVKVKRVEYEMLGVLALEGIKLLKAEIDELKDEIRRLKK